MNLIILLEVLISYFAFTEGTICLNCRGRNAAECRGNGKLIECNVGEVCATTIRRNGMVSSMIKRCKQREACLNEQKLNWMKVGAESYKCNYNRRQSTCRCCCFDDHCNVNERCTAVDRSVIRCPALDEPFRHGTRRCSKGNQSGSVCRVRCSSSYEVNPSFSERITCLPNGKWDKPVPCCSLPCPPNLYADLVLLRHFQDHRNLLRTTKQQLAAFLKKVSIGPNSLYLAQPHYDSTVHTPYIGFRESATLTSEELLNLSIAEFENATIDPSVVNTGEALRHVHREIFNTEFDRPDARNIIAFVTDHPSDDDVSAAARVLRESGVTIYSYYFKTNTGESPSDAEFLEISGFEDRRRIIIPTDDTVANEGLFANLCPNACRIP